MVKCWLIYNGFLNNGEISQPVKWLYEKAIESNMQIVFKKNSELITVYKEGKIGILGYKKQDLPEYAIFWDKDVQLASTLEKSGIKLYNKAKAIEICDDKAMTYNILADHGIKMPKTIVAPKTYEKIGYNDNSYNKAILKEMHFPIIIKECFGSLGEQVYKANNEEEMQGILQKIGVKPHIYQEFIKCSEGRDVRVQVVGGKIIASMFRYNDRDFRSNVALGGKTRIYEPSEEMKKQALECCRIIGLDFAGVDFLIGENGEPILCEVNSNPNMQGLYECTGINTASYIIDYINKKAQGAL